MFHPVKKAKQVIKDNEEYVAGFSTACAAGTMVFLYLVAKGSIQNTASQKVVGSEMFTDSRGTTVIGTKMANNLWYMFDPTPVKD